MAEALGIGEEGARRPVAVLVGEDAFEHDDLLALGMVVGGKARVRLVAHHGSDLARLGRVAESSLYPRYAEPHLIDRPIATLRLG